MVIRERLVAAFVTLKGVAHLVCEYLDISLGAVEVGKDVRHAKRGERRAETTTRLAVDLGSADTNSVPGEIEVDFTDPAPGNHRVIQMRSN